MRLPVVLSLKIYFPGPRFFSTSSHSLHSSHQRDGPSASEKLFADAAAEEAEGTSIRQKSSYLQTLEQKHENWDGEERMQDAVLRMLVDKYKPLRSGTITTAEQKIKQTPPKITSFTKPSSGSWATESLLPSSETHRPWHTEFKAPSHAVSSVKFANIPPSPPVRVATGPQDEKAKKKEREMLKRTEHAGRLGRAKESTLDYRLGLKNKGESSQLSAGARPNPVSMRGWTSLIEDKIEKARIAGVFNHVKGRGQPLARTIEEKNPFIGREEFLMNRIVQKNGAAPPWVELQNELDTAVSTFRNILRQSYVRRIVRTLTALHPPAVIATQFTLQDVKAHRDPEWEENERGYHDVAIDEINALVRKYNGVAPYAVRRAYYMRSVEIERLYDECAEDVLKGLKERVEGSTSTGNTRKSPEVSRRTAKFVEGQQLDEGFVSFRDLLLGWADRLLAKWDRKTR
ncbi:hypothetical protein EV361DRAFT_848463 [Lentinula raphanica]|uniref:DnaJ homologue subfamily C member 28 conserved domain-containing protein n=1 Tax=Lentinula raphanica TaxID=153919 RepID=A0AA38PAG7_9AGAR|nr:hypothetical protein C8R42DRAFT_608204 [Lentinula raphanica]KAJ3819213.1 hypothetical protein F5880DRAFT_1724673 [Lentinula raphanica]KAJ3839314.1 hypothetical protein F5878DRAFT_560939 [Lentinula raphanica]KAJ3970519.1 hypothetical protein EV361DRAFT_848463 [Lentinula raphanica]